MRAYRVERTDQCAQEIDSITVMENFILGFRLGVRLMAECMDEDGDLVDGGER